jgi:sulfite reductase (NADPH) flavoprotein alpha-component
MHTHMIQSAGSVNQADARIINILYGSQTGNAESVANDAAAVAKAHGLKPLVKSMGEIEIGALAAMEYLLIVTSTYGEGKCLIMPNCCGMRCTLNPRPALNTQVFRIGIGRHRL